MVGVVPIRPSGFAAEVGSGVDAGPTAEAPFRACSVSARSVDRVLLKVFIEADRETLLLCPPRPDANAAAAASICAAEVPLTLPEEAAMGGLRWNRNRSEEPAVVSLLRMLPALARVGDVGNDEPGTTVGSSIARWSSVQLSDARSRIGGGEAALLLVPVPASRPAPADS